MFPPQSRTLEAYLGQGDGTARLLEHARLLQRLARIYADVTPEHLGQASRVANYKSGTVVIHADNGAVAARLRQMAPTLTREFCQRGVECNELRVKVQAREIPLRSSTSAPRPLSEPARASLATLAGALPPSPLRKAIETLVARAATPE